MEARAYLSKDENGDYRLRLVIPRTETSSGRTIQVKRLRNPTAAWHFMRRNGLRRGVTHVTLFNETGEHVQGWPGPKSPPESSELR